MKSLTIILFILLSGGFCFGQFKTPATLAYYEELSIEANKVFPNSAYKTFNLDSLNKALFASGKAHVKIDTSARWKLLFEYSDSWKYIAGQTPTIQLIPEGKPVVPKLNYRTAYDSCKVYTGLELFNGLEIDTAFLNIVPNVWLKEWNHATDSIKGFHHIHKRNDPLNRVCVPIMTDDYLLLRYVHSYPDGNMTSFYKEVIFYFKRE